MESNSKDKKITTAIKANAELNIKIEKIEKEIQPALYEQSFDKSLIKEETEKELNLKILEITMNIQNQYPELSKYLEEMPVTIPDEKHPEITLKNLNAYYNSLTTILNRYILEHRNKSK
ncbi:MAG: hypothetical protein A3F72_05785 [Bacteroidetes bacterium RIFCSPLOWO2_12_FULL_35_15]|nr:MAG: hypothetical protein A3F72_05785 [Bacteroidetes bacterium RIFCSPLOWO2_12_FULL_35_15]